MNEQQNGQNTQTGDAGNTPAETKFCRECGAKISKKALICPQCGCATESYTAPRAQQPQVVINNSNQNQQNMQGMLGHKKNKWVAFWLCFFFGIFGAHKFYEGKVGMGILYLLTGGLFGIGTFINFWQLLFRSNPYYV